MGLCLQGACAGGLVLRGTVMRGPAEVNYVTGATAHGKGLKLLTQMTWTKKEQVWYLLPVWPGDLFCMHPGHWDAIHVL